MSVAIFNCRRCQIGRRREYPHENPAAGQWYRLDGERRVYPGEEAACPRCGWLMRWNYLQASLDPSVLCTSVCEMARGHTCNCACGGQNHGRAWAS